MRSPYRRWSATRVGKTAIHFAAVEIAKAIASGFPHRSARSHRKLRPDRAPPSPSTTCATRPQCPTCGSKKLQNPRRAPAPIELAEGKKLVMTSGGYRTVTSRATVARFRKHVSPLTGVVTRLERIEADLPMNTNFFAHHNFSAPARSIDQLRSGLSGGSFGKGSTAEQGEASALMEAIERYSGIFQGDEIRTTRRFADFAPGDALLPNDVQLFSETQFKTGMSQLPDDSHPVPEPFDPVAKTEWSPVWSLRDKRFKYLPTGLLYFFYGGFHTDSNGCAAGNTREEAIVQGFLELVERDAYAIWWYNRLQRAEVDLSQFDDSYVRDLKTQFADAGRKLWVLDITSDLGIPTYVAIMHWMQNGHENIEFGSGAHFDRRIALLRSLTELNQFLSIGLMGGGSGEKPSLDGVTPLRLEDYPVPDPERQSDRPAERRPQDLRDNTRDQVDACVEIAGRAGYDFLVLDQTRPDVEVPVVRVLVPGLRHFYRRFAPGPALRCPGEARIAGPAATGKRTHSVPSTHLKGIGSCALPGKSRAGRSRQHHCRPAERPLLPRNAGRTEASPPLRATIRSASDNSAPRRSIARGICAPACRSRPLPARQRPREGSRCSWCGAWRGAGFWNTASRSSRDSAGLGGHRTPGPRLLAANARSSAAATRSCCRALPICAGAATRWCWNRRAPARCSGFAIPPSPPPLLPCRTPQRSASFASKWLP